MSMRGVLVLVVVVLGLVALFVFSDFSAEPPGEQARPGRSLVSSDPGAEQTLKSDPEEKEVPPTGVLPQPTPTSPPTEVTVTEPEVRLLTWEEVEQLLVQHDSAFVQGRFSTCSKIEQQLEHAPPLSGLESFRQRVMGKGEFAYRERLVKLLRAGDESLLAELMTQEADRFAKTSTDSTEWKEGEIDFLTSLGKSYALFALSIPDGINTLGVVLSSIGSTDLQREIVLTLEELPPSVQRKDYLPLLRRLLDSPLNTKNDEAQELLFVVCVMLLRFEDERAKRRDLLELERVRALRSRLLHLVYVESLLPWEDLRVVIPEALRSDQNSDIAAELFTVLVDAMPDQALSFARERYGEAPMNAKLRTALFEVLLNSGSNVDRELVVAEAGSSRSAAAEAVRVLGARGELALMEDIFQRGQSIAAKAAAFHYLAVGEQREAWLERGLRPDQPLPLRVTAVALLDPKTGSERARLQTLVEADQNAIVRERALRLLGTLNDPNMRAFFESVRDSAAPKTVRNLAKKYVDAFDKALDD